ncbi:nad3 (mitochondrion) [Ooceraea biroi]|uniref:NADH-ubiquinone oxidoreductase chain 3 n=1 Tax=Ooceraea biroi TaxID=2015173 RepID=A0A3L8D479_OOCBI|nr:nad3 [Ooceraea biroi]
MILTMYLIFLLLMMIPSILLTLNLMISKKKVMGYEKLTPFECGFDPQSLNRLPFSIQFFLMGMIFLIFDIEITLLIPLTFITSYFFKLTIYTSMFFIFILLLGLYNEYLEKSLEWKL